VLHARSQSSSVPTRDTLIGSGARPLASLQDPEYGTKTDGATGGGCTGGAGGGLGGSGGAGGGDGGGDGGGGDDGGNGQSPWHTK